MSSSDYSSFALFTAGLAIFAPLVAGQSLANIPGGSDPTGPAIYQPNLNAVVPAGQQFSVTWKAGDSACGDKVDLVLLKGPSSSQMAAQSYIAQGIDNSGTYAWTPSTSLEPSQSDYGIELICPGNKAYQYTTRFGISNDKYKGSDSTSTTTTTTTTPAGYGGYGHSSSSASLSSSTATPSGHNSSSTSTTSSHRSSETPKYPIGTATGGAAYPNGTQPSPTGSVTVPTTLRTSSPVPTGTSKTSNSASASAPSQTGNAAMNVKAGLSGLVAAAGLAVFAL